MIYSNNNKINKELNLTETIKYDQMTSKNQEFHSSKDKNYKLKLKEEKIKANTDSSESFECKNYYETDNECAATDTQSPFSYKIKEKQNNKEIPKFNTQTLELDNNDIGSYINNYAINYLGYISNNQVNSDNIKDLSSSSNLKNINFILFKNTMDFINGIKEVNKKQSSNASNSKRSIEQILFEFNNSLIKSNSPINDDSLYVNNYIMIGKKRSNPNKSNENTNKADKIMNKKLQVKNAVVKYREKQKQLQSESIKENKILKLILKETYNKGGLKSIYNNESSFNLKEVINKLILEKPYLRDSIDNTKYSYSNKSILEYCKKTFYNNNNNLNNKHKYENYNMKKQEYEIIKEEIFINKQTRKSNNENSELVNMNYISNDYSKDSSEKINNNNDKFKISNFNFIISDKCEDDLDINKKFSFSNNSSSIMASTIDEKSYHCQNTINQKEIKNHIQEDRLSDTNSVRINKSISPSNLRNNQDGYFKNYKMMNEPAQSTYANPSINGEYINNNNILNKEENNLGYKSIYNIPPINANNYDINFSNNFNLIADEKENSYFDNCFYNDLKSINGINNNDVISITNPFYEDENEFNIFSNDRENNYQKSQSFFNSNSIKNTNHNDYDIFENNVPIDFSYFTSNIN